MASRGLQLLKLSFLIGTIADLVVAVNWFLIATGAEIPNMMCGLSGEGEEYRFAMYIAGLFMAGWATILAWGWFRPLEKGTVADNLGAASGFDSPRSCFLSHTA